FKHRKSPRRREVIASTRDACATREREPMRKFYTLLSCEVSSYFYSPIAYIVLVFFLFVSGADLYFQMSFMNQRPVEYAVQEGFFTSAFFPFALVFTFPIITSRLFADEFTLATID